VVAADFLAAPTGQPRIGRRHHAERRVGRRGDQQVVGDRLISPPASIIASLEAEPLGELVLDRGRELPVEAAIEESAIDLRIELRDVRARRAKVEVGEAPALAVRLKVPQVAIGDEVAIRVGPVTGRVA
jgi:hypothetical protein